MTSEGLGEMFEGVDGGPSGGSRVLRPGSEDPHRRQRNLFITASEHALLVRLQNFPNPTALSFTIFALW